MPRDWLALPAFAKINTSLELLGRRSDGYTEIRTVYQSVTLHDRLRLRLTRTGEIVVRVAGGGAPSGRANLVYRALSRGRGFLGLRCGIEAELEKHIPAARGLGGGSSDAAAALVGLLRLTRTRLTSQELERLGRSVGADVPFFFLGGRALGVGRGDEVYALADRPRQWCVLVCPPRPLATRSAYAWAAAAARRLTLKGRAAKITGLRSSPDALWATGNEFETAVFPRFPELARMKAALLAEGARQAGLSGSGSTVFALFSRRAAAQRAAERLAEAGRVFLVQTLPGQAYRRALGLWLQ